MPGDGDAAKSIGVCMLALQCLLMLHAKFSVFLHILVAVARFKMSIPACLFGRGHVTRFASRSSSSCLYQFDLSAHFSPDVCQEKAFRTDYTPCGQTAIGPKQSPSVKALEPYRTQVVLIEQPAKE